LQRAAKWSLVATLTALAATLAAAGYGVIALFVNLARSGAAQLNPWTQTPVIAVQQPALSLVDLGLIGVILILVGLLTAVLLQGRRGVDPQEAKLLQELHRGLVRMERRLDRVENLVMKQVGGIFVGPRAN